MLTKQFKYLAFIAYFVSPFFLLRFVRCFPTVPNVRLCFKFILGNARFLLQDGKSMYGLRAYMHASENERYTFTFLPHSDNAMVCDVEKHGGTGDESTTHNYTTTSSTGAASTHTPNSRTRRAHRVSIFYRRCWPFSGCPLLVFRHWLQPPFFFLVHALFAKTPHRASVLMYARVCVCMPA